MKKILITGAAKRIGRAIALHLAAEGHEVTVHYNRSVPDAKKLAKICFTVKADLRLRSEIKRLVETAAKKMGGLDVIINNAGIFYMTPMDAITERDWRDFFDVHVLAPFWLAKYGAKYLKRAKTGHIITLADAYGLSPAARFLPYGVSRAAEIALMQGLQKVLAPHIKIDTILLGPVMRKKGDSPAAFKRAMKGLGLKRPMELKTILSTIDSYLSGD